MPKLTSGRNPRTITETLKVSADERELIRRAARKSKTKRTAFVRAAAIAEATRVLQKAA